MASKLPAVNQGRLDLLSMIEARIETEAKTAYASMATIRLGLLEIQNQDLWRDAGASSFVAYCAERWAMNVSASYRAITWAREMLVEHGTPAAVFHARETGAPVLSGRVAVARAQERRAPRGKPEAIETPAVVTRHSKPATAVQEVVASTATHDTKPRQLALFDVPTDDILDELDARAAKADDRAREAMRARVRALLTSLTAREKTPTGKCQCVGNARKPTGYGICTTCKLRTQ